MEDSRTNVADELIIKEDKAWVEKRKPQVEGLPHDHLRPSPPINWGRVLVAGVCPKRTDTSYGECAILGLACIPFPTWSEEIPSLLGSQLHHL